MANLLTGFYPADIYLFKFNNEILEQAEKYNQSK